MHKPLRFRLGLALVAVPLVGQLLTVFFLGVNTPSADEFAYIDFIRALREGGRWLPMLFYQHNEHRVVPVKVTMALLQPFVGWNPKVEMYVSVLLAGLVLLGLWRLYRRAGGTDLLLFAPAAWLFCNLAQYENMLYGLQMCHYFTVAGVVWALVFLDEERMAPRSSAASSPRGRSSTGFSSGPSGSSCSSRGESVRRGPPSGRAWESPPSSSISPTSRPPASRPCIQGRGTCRIWSGTRS